MKIAGAGSGNQYKFHRELFSDIFLSDLLKNPLRFPTFCGNLLKHRHILEFMMCRSELNKRRMSSQISNFSNILELGIHMDSFITCTSQLCRYGFAAAVRCYSKILALNGIRRKVYRSDTRAFLRASWPSQTTPITKPTKHLQHDSSSMKCLKAAKQICCYGGT